MQVRPPKQGHFCFCFFPNPFAEDKLKLNTTSKTYSSSPFAAKSERCRSVFYTHKAIAGLFYFYKKISNKFQIKIHLLKIKACSKKLVIEFDHMLLSLKMYLVSKIYNNVALNKIKNLKRNLFIFLNYNIF